MSVNAPPPGAVLLGKYRVERVLGEGGMGVVVMARHLQLDEPVAIKFLLKQLAGSDEVIQRFVREAQAAVKLKSEHVARVTDVGTMDDGAPYMVMEYLEGGDLGAYVKHYRRLHPPLVVDLMLQACEALAEAHALGIVHRDVKPSNFFIASRRDGSPLLKVLDFGISKAPVAAAGDLTRTQSIMGTPAYMSPEQMRSTKTVDPRSDIWSLGVVMYECLSGHRPFDSEAFSELCIKVAMDDVPALDVQLPGDLGRVVARCLEKDPSARFQNVAELAVALAPYASDPGQGRISAERASRMLGKAPPTMRPSTAADATVAMPGSQPSGLVPPWQVGTEPRMATPTSLGTGVGQVGAHAPRRGRLVLVLGVAAAGIAGAVIAVALGSKGAAKSSAPSDRGSAAGREAPGSVDQPGSAGTASATTEPAIADAAPVEPAMTPDAGVVDAAVAAPSEKKPPRHEPRPRPRPRPRPEEDPFGSRE